jgi:vitamin B12 transporter
MGSQWCAWFLALDIVCVLHGQTTLADEPPSVDLPVVEIVTTPTPSSDAHNMSTRDPTATVSTVELGERRLESKSLADFLIEAPGVVVRDTGGIGQTKTISIRGASPNAVLLLLDGMPLQGSGVSVDLSRFHPSVFSSVEVMRGVGAREQPGALGGVVNLTSRDERGLRAIAMLSHGSFESTQGSAVLSSPLFSGQAVLIAHGLRSIGRFDYAFDALPDIGTDALSTLPRENNQASQAGMLLKWKRYLGDSRIDVLADGLTEQRGLAGTVYNPTASNTQSSLRGLLGVRFSHLFDEHQRLSITASMRADQLELLNSPFLVPRFSQTDFGATIEGRYFHRVGINDFEMLLTGGGDTVNASQNSAVSQGRVGAMLADSIALVGERLTLSPSIRFDVTGPFVTLSPKLGARFAVLEELTVSANAGVASRPPSFFERSVRQGALLSNPDLKPERATQADVNVRWSQAGLTLSVGGFVGLVENLISYELFPPMLAKPFNFAAASHSGIECEAGFRFRQFLSVHASYTFLQSLNVRDTPEYYLRPLPFRPTHTLSASVYAGPPQLQLRVDGVYTSSQFQNRGATLSVPGRVLVNGGVQSTIARTPQLSVGFEMKNLFDVSTVDQSGYPLPPRSFFFTASVQWENSST